MSDPIDPHPTAALVESYTYHSPLPTWVTDSYDREEEQEQQQQPDRTDEQREREEEGWVLGIDEAGRGPVLGPMVYAAAYCPLSFRPRLHEMGFDDSKVLSAETRQTLWNAFKSNPQLCYSSTTLSPQSISESMLRASPFNLNRQAEEATIGLIWEALGRGVKVREVFVDALGPAAQWQAKLKQIFPTLAITVEAKADSTYKIVSAASIVAKVTRDRWVEGWVHPEGDGVKGRLVRIVKEVPKGSKDKAKGKKVARKAKGKKVVREEEATDRENDDGEEDEQEDSPRAKRRKLTRGEESEDLTSAILDLPVDPVQETEEEEVWREELGSGYPSDPKTQQYLRSRFNPIFGYPSIVRFSWAGPKLALEKEGKKCVWVDDNGDAGQKKLNFPTTRKEVDEGKGRARLCRDLGLGVVGEL